MAGTTQIPTGMFGHGRFRWEIPWVSPVGDRAAAGGRWLCQAVVRAQGATQGDLAAGGEDGTSPVQSSIRAGTRYSFVETLEHGRCWKLRRLQMRDEDGVEFSTEPLFFTVLNECLVG